MTTLLMTADYRDMSVWDLTTGTVSLSDDRARTGTYSFKVDNNSRLRKNVAGGTEYYVKCAVYVAGSLAAGELYFVDTNLTAVHAYLEFSGRYSTFNAYAGTNNPLVATLAGISWGRWNVIEARLVLHATTGSLTVKLNGNQVIAVTNINTINGGNGQIGRISFGQTWAASGHIAYFDDIVIRDDRWPGRGSIYVLDPVADGTDDAWTPSTGTDKYAVVDDNPPDDFVDYVSTDAAVGGTKQLFDPDTLADIWFPAGSCVQVNNKVKLTSGHANLSGLFYDGVDRFSGDVNVVTTTAKHVTYSKAVTTLTGLEFGVETIAW